MSNSGIPINKRGDISPNDSEAFEKSVYRKITWRLIPFLFLCYIFAYIDRVNVGFAMLQMQQDLGMTDAVYGAGAGIFFIGYFFFEVPCNIALQKIGAKYWLGPIMVVWGVVSVCTMLVRVRRSLHHSLSARRRGIGIFPRRDPLFHLLVPEKTPSQDGGRFHDGDPLGGRDWRSYIGLAPREYVVSGRITAGSGCTCSKQCRRLLQDWWRCSFLPTVRKKPNG